MTKILWPILVCLALTGCGQSANVSPEPKVLPKISVEKNARVDKIEQAIKQITETVNNQIEENQTLRASVENVKGNLTQANYDLSPSQLRLFYLIASIAVGLFLIALPLTLPAMPWLKLTLCILGAAMLAAPLALLFFT